MWTEVDHRSWFRAGTLLVLIEDSEPRWTERGWCGCSFLVLQIIFQGKTVKDEHGGGAAAALSWLCFVIFDAALMTP